MSSEKKFMVRGQFILVKVLEWVGGETFEQFMDVPIGGSKGGPLSVQILHFHADFGKYLVK